MVNHVATQYIVSLTIGPGIKVNDMWAHPKPERIDKNRIFEYHDEKEQMPCFPWPTILHNCIMSMKTTFWEGENGVGLFSSTYKSRNFVLERRQ